MRRILFLLSGFILYFFVLPQNVNVDAQTCQRTGFCASSSPCPDGYETRLGGDNSVCENLGPQNVCCVPVEDDGGGGGSCDELGDLCSSSTDCCSGLSCSNTGRCCAKRGSSCTNDSQCCLGGDACISGTCQDDPGGGGGDDPVCGNGACEAGESTTCDEDCGDPGGGGGDNNRCGASCTRDTFCAGASDGCTDCSGGICRNPGGGGSPTNTPTPTRTPTPTNTPTPTPTPLPHIEGTVFIDEDGDQEFDDGDELGLEDAVISVSSEEGCGLVNVWGPVTTTSEGEYEFPDLCYGDFIVTIGDIPSGYVKTSPTTQTTTLQAIFQHSDVVNFAVEDAFKVSGTLSIDNDGPDCSGTVVYGDGGTSTLFQDGAELDSLSIAPDGTFLLATLNTGNNFHVVLSGTSPYVPVAYRINGGACTRLSGFDMGPFSIPPDANSIEFFVSDALPWYQTQSGDVRMNSISNTVAGGQYASVGSPSSVFFSSEFNADFGVGGSSAGGEEDRWVVNREYLANSGPIAKRGTVSYSYYDFQVQQLDTQPETLCASSCTLDIGGRDSLETGVFRVNGDVTFDGLQQVSGSRTVVLVDGDVTINTEIPFVSRSTILFLLASGNITIAPNIGTTTLSSSAPFHLSGIFSAEGSIIIDGGGCEAGVPDRRLNVYGTLIANSLLPFSDSGEGIVENRRSLCGDNTAYPSYTVSSRYDILTLLTDFYKVKNEVWREVSP